MDSTDESAGAQRGTAGDVVAHSPAPEADASLGDLVLGPPESRRWRRPYLVSLLVLIIAAVQLAMPKSVTVGPVWLIPAIEVVGAPAVLVVFGTSNPSRRALRAGVNAYGIFLIGASVLNAVLLFRTLLEPVPESGTELLLAGIGVLWINVLSFALIYWWLDGGGPFVRRARQVKRWDFLFPQQGGADQQWVPGLGDYMFTAYTNIVAFSPTDTMPLTHRVKLLFVIQSGVALLTIVVTLSRSINLLP